MEVNTVPDIPLFLGVLKAQGPVGQGHIFLPNKFVADAVYMSDPI